MQLIQKPIRAKTKNIQTIFSFNDNNSCVMSFSLFLFRLCPTVKWSNRTRENFNDVILNVFLWTAREHRWWYLTTVISVEIWTMRWLRRTTILTLTKGRRKYLARTCCAQTRCDYFRGIFCIFLVEMWQNDKTKFVFSRARESMQCQNEAQRWNKLTKQKWRVKDQKTNVICLCWQHIKWNAHDEVDFGRPKTERQPNCMLCGCALWAASLRFVAASVVELPTLSTSI